MSFCEKCGKELSGENFCPACGSKIDIKVKNIPEETVENTVPPTVDCAVIQPAGVVNEVKVSKLPKKVVLVVVGVAVLVITAVIILLSNRGPNFKKIYKDYCSPLWAEVGSDGSFLSVDTNPFDEDDNGIAYYDAYVAIEEINAALDLPDALFEDMINTTGNDGKQIEEYKKITVSWKYHPDKGLEVIYRKQ